MTANKIQKDSLPPEARVRGAVYNLQKAEGTFDQLTFHTETEISNSLGIALKRDVVVSVKRGSCLQGIVKAGDILLSLNDFKLTEDTQHNNEGISRIMKPEKNISHWVPYMSKNLKITVTLLRLRSKYTEKLILPAKFTPRKFHTYECIQLFWIRGMELGLELKEIDNMCFVVGLVAGGIANMGLSIGDRILDVNEKEVKTTEEAKKEMLESFNAKGFVRICIEVPGSDVIKNQLRPKIQTFSPLDIPPELLEYAAKGINALKNGKPGKIVIKEAQNKEPSQLKSPLQFNIKKKKVSFTDKSTEYGHFVDNKTRLFVAIPPAKTVKSEAARCTVKKKKKDENTDNTGKEKGKMKPKKTDSQSTIEEESVPKKNKSNERLSAEKAAKKKERTIETEEEQSEKIKKNAEKTVEEKGKMKRKKTDSQSTIEEVSSVPKKNKSNERLSAEKATKKKERTIETAEEQSEKLNKKSNERLSAEKATKKKERTIETEEEQSEKLNKKAAEKILPKPNSKLEKLKVSNESREKTQEATEDGEFEKESPKKKEITDDKESIIESVIVAKSPVKSPLGRCILQKTEANCEDAEEDKKDLTKPSTARVTKIEIERKASEEGLCSPAGSSEGVRNSKE